MPAWRTAPAVKAIFTQANRLYPTRNKTSDGTIGDPAHRSRPSDHNPDERGVVTAGDLTHDPASGCDCNHLSSQVVRRRDRRLKYLIWDRRIISGDRGPSPWVWRAYGGANPHTRHMHISVLADRDSDASPWFDEEDDMTPEQEAILKQARDEAREAKIIAAEARTVGHEAKNGTGPLGDLVRDIIARLERIETSLKSGAHGHG